MSEAENKGVIICCDEAGNSGPNYLDMDQPFYVLACWIVPYEQIVEASVAAELHRQMFRSDATELKGAKLVKSARGKEILISLLRRLGNLRCIPIFEVVEKRYCVAAKIVETLMDPAFNDTVFKSFIPDSTTKQEIANALYANLPTAVLDRFANAYRHPTPKEFGEVLDDITHAVKEHINPELANLIDGCNPNIKEIVEVEMGKSELGNAIDSLNLPVFVQMLMMIEVLGRLQLIEPVKFVHDKILPYQRGFKDVFERMKRANEGVYAFPNGGVVVLPLRTISHLEFDSSHQCVLIQAADCLASSINHLAKLAIWENPVDDLDTELASLIFPALLIDFPIIAWSVGSDRWVRALGSYYITPVVKTKLEVEPTLSNTLAIPRHEPVTTDSVPLLPRLGASDPTSNKLKRFLWPCPVYAVVDASSECLLCLDISVEPAIPGNTATVLFSSRMLASDFLREFQEHSVMRRELTIQELGPDKLLTLVHHLEKIQPYADTLLFDSNSSKAAAMSVTETLSGLRQSVDRVQRALSTGIYKQLLVVHKIGTVEVKSYLTSDGHYVAFREPDGEICKASTREEAVKKAQESKDTQ